MPVEKWLLHAVIKLRVYSVTKTLKNIRKDV